MPLFFSPILHPLSICLEGGPGTRQLAVSSTSAQLWLVLAAPHRQHRVFLVFASPIPTRRPCPLHPYLPPLAASHAFAVNCSLHSDNGTCHRLHGVKWCVCVCGASASSDGSTRAPVVARFRRARECRRVASFRPSSPPSLSPPLFPFLSLHLAAVLHHVRRPRTQRVRSCVSLQAAAPRVSCGVSRLIFCLCSSHTPHVLCPSLFLSLNFTPASAALCCWFALLNGGRSLCSGCAARAASPYGAPFPCPSVWVS